jgi:hypothetical protein
MTPRSKQGGKSRYTRRHQHRRHRSS